MRRKSALKLYLSPVSCKWLDFKLNNSKCHEYHGPLVKLLNILIEKMPTVKTGAFRHSHETIVFLPEESKPNRFGRSVEIWISPDKMLLLDSFLEKMWKQELCQFVTKSEGLMINAEKQMQIGLIRDFSQKYDLSIDDLPEFTAQKLVNRYKSKLKTMAIN